MFWKRRPKINTGIDAVRHVVTRGVAEVLPNTDDLIKLLTSGKRIRLYQGFDPTGTNLHIGHMVGLRKLKQFQDLGHEVIFLIGDGTGQAGDPSGKMAGRTTFFTHKELLANAKKYKEQAGKILNFSGDNPVQIKFNGEWLNKLTLTDVLDIASNFTLQQLSERDIFERRIEKGESVNLREFLYPLLQGYDSVAMEVDLEIGATDQTFNMLVGRTLLKRYKEKEKFVLTTPLLTDASGKKIGKSEGNVIGLLDTPENLYGKIMSLGDAVIIPGLIYLTDTPDEDIKEIEKALHTENPKQFKERLAYEVTLQLHGKEKANRAQQAFVSAFQKGEVPERIPKVSAKIGDALADVVVASGIVSSKSEWRRLVTDAAVKDMFDGSVLNSHTELVRKTVTLKIGKHRFLKIELL